VSPADVGYSLGTTRTAFWHRAVIIAGPQDDLEEPVTLAGSEGLAALARGEAAANLVEGATREAGKIVFVFPGQGSQWAGMAAELLDSSPVFREQALACARALAPHTGWWLIDVLRGAPGAPTADRVDVTQPVLFAVMVCLAELWRAAGVRPDAVTGHSQGEIAAAYVAGALSLDDAARIVALRSQALCSLAGTGAMASVPLPAAEVSARLSSRQDGVAIAAINSPGVTVVAGDPGAVTDLVTGLGAEGVQARVIAVDYASHTAAVELVRDRVLSSLEDITPRASAIAFYSTVTGGLLDTDQLDADYWYRNLRQTVQFERATRALRADGHRLFAEVSPHPVLTPGIRQTVDVANAEPAAVIGTLRRGEGGWRRLLTSFAHAYVNGASIDWGAVIGTLIASPAKPRPVRLPGYAFQRQRYWLDTQAERDEALASNGVLASDGVLASRLAGLSEAEAGQVLAELVGTHAAIVLGHATAEAIDTGRSFKELGFDSPSLVELRDRLVAVTGLNLPVTVLFSFPSPAAVARHLQAELAGVQPRAGLARVDPDEPVAIVAMACRYPGGADTPERLWQLAADGTDAISGFPVNRGWDIDVLYHPDPEHPGTSYTRHSGFLHDADQFEPAFFGIGPREAAAMDPQQRLLLELGWEAFERAGINPAAARETRTGVFVGEMAQEYGPSLHHTPDELAGYRLTGSLASVASGRLSYFFGLDGPAITVDTACSSSLVALHLACHALRRDECSMALVGGVTVMAAPGMFIEFSRQRGLAPDGRCKSFAAAANGTALAEGAGMLLVERLSDAHRNGHPVLALVRGSAVNQDGASNGLTAPSGDAQQRVIQSALARADLRPADVDALEAHGTGTPLGDPIEAEAILRTYGQNRPQDRPLLLGSVKSNIGHTQAAAGIAGIIKMVLAMDHGRIPASLHIDQPSPQVDWSSGAVRLLTDPVPWPETGRPRRAAVSSFGVSGTNAHVILEQAVTQHTDLAAVQAAGQLVTAGPVTAGPMGGGPVGGGPVLAWPVSARSEAALRDQARRLRDFLSANPDADLADVGCALATGRAAFAHRAVLLGARHEDFLNALAGLADDTHDAGNDAIVVRGVAAAGSKTAVVFPGQGSQRLGMGGQLYAAYPAFREAFDQACGYLDPLVERPLRDVINAAPGPAAQLLDQTIYTQTALFAVETAMFRLAESWGVTADCVIGHSIGELTAAHVAGVLSLRDACVLVAARGRLMQALSGNGAMIAIGATEEEVQAELAGRADQIAVAAINGPASVVLSGDQDVVAEIAARWQERGRKIKRLRVSHAFHSPHMEAMCAEFADIAGTLTFGRPHIPIISNLTGQFAEAEQLCSPDYWVRHARQPVRYLDGIRRLRAWGVTRFIEIGPGAILTAMNHDCLGGPESEPGPLLVATLRDESSEARSMLTALARAHVHGATVDWAAVGGGRRPAVAGLPTYPFQRQRCWMSMTPLVTAAVEPGVDQVSHPLLTASVTLADGGATVFTGRLSLDSHGWLADHAVLGTVLVPGTAFVELALEAGRQAGCSLIEELSLAAPLVVPEQGVVRLQVIVGPADGAGRRQIAIYSRREDPPSDDLGTDIASGLPSGGNDGRAAAWTRHATGILSGADGQAPFGAVPPDLDGAWPEAAETEISPEDLYLSLAEAGLGYGSAFRAVRAARKRGEEIYAEISLPGQLRADADRFGLHPALLDAALHPLGLAGFFRSGTGSAVCVPFAWTGVRVQHRGATDLRVRLSPTGPDSVTITITDGHGMPVASVESLTVRPVSAERLAVADEMRDPIDSLLRLDWIPAPVTAAATARARGRWAVLGRDDDTLTTGVPGASVHADLASLRAAIGSGSVPDVVLLPAAAAGSGDENTAAAARTVTHWVLGAVNEWLADGRFAASSLVFITRGAVAAGDGDDVPDLAHAPLWGLVRAAQAENPGRFILLDLDSEDVGDRTLEAAAACGEPQLAVRDGSLLVPRLARPGTGGAHQGAEPYGAAESRDALDLEDLAVLAGVPDLPDRASPPSPHGIADAPDLLGRLDSPDEPGTVLVTGATGAVGKVVVRHLVATHRVMHLLLVTRRGLSAPGAAEFESELTALGATVRTEACDIANRDALGGILASIPPEYPLTAVIHAAGVVDDGTTAALTADAVEAVLRPKVDGGWNLHELTKHAQLRAFVLFSSVAAIVGNAGQGNYAAANAFLDALAHHRRARGLAATSLAWGLWKQADGMMRHLDAVGLARVTRNGIAPMTDEHGLALFDAAMASGQVLLVPALVDMAGRAGSTLPPPLRGLLTLPESGATATGGALSLATRLDGVPVTEQGRMVRDLVRGEVAKVLGHASAESIEAEYRFSELGFDSLAEIELRNKLNAATGLRLPAYFTAEYPTPAMLADYLMAEIAAELVTSGQGQQ
jgi:acyl transferase domain-containing protein/NADP-dependent 3-hydroxy acid dehydrogenase YdfG